MYLTQSQCIICVLFFLIIIVIMLYYINYNISNTISNKSLEGFYDASNPSNQPSPSKIETQTKTMSISTKDIANIDINQAVNKNITLLDELLNKYVNIDSAITITNDGTLCDDAVNQFSTNTCSINTNSNLMNNTDYQCLVNNNYISCSDYVDNVITDNITINIQSLKDNTVSQIILNANKLSLGINGLTSMINNVNNKMNILTEQLNLENQQNYFIKYNTINLKDKQKIIDKTIYDFEKAENDININSLNFSYLLEKNKKNTLSQDLYYKIIIGLIITIIVIGFINILISNM